VCFVNLFALNKRKSSVYSFVDGIKPGQILLLIN